MRVKTKHDIYSRVWDGRNLKSLKPNKTYTVIQISHDNYRVINELGEPILYPKYLFHVVQRSIPENWIKDQYDEGEYYISPPELSKSGFYENYFDGVPEAVAILERFLMRIKGKF